MSTWVLFIILTTKSGVPTAVTAQEFNGAQACTAAMDWLRERYPTAGLMCTLKTIPPPQPVLQP